MMIDTRKSANAAAAMPVELEKASSLASISKCSKFDPQFWSTVEIDLPP
jgi:hypothetical protein